MHCCNEIITNLISAPLHGLHENELEEREVRRRLGNSAPYPSKRNTDITLATHFEVFTKAKPYVDLVTAISFLTAIFFLGAFSTASKYGLNVNIHLMDKGMCALLTGGALYIARVILTSFQCSFNARVLKEYQ